MAAFFASDQTKCFQILSVQSQNCARCLDTLNCYQINSMIVRELPFHIYFSKPSHMQEWPGPRGLTHLALDV